jgi:hypothetical protein
VWLGGTLAADSAAKAAPSLAAIAVAVPVTDYRGSVNCCLEQKWQMEQDAETSNKLHAMEPVTRCTVFYRLPRRYEILIHRLRVGHYSRNSRLPVERLESAAMFGVW